MRKITTQNMIYIQDGYNFNMYQIDSNTNDLLYHLSVSMTDDYHISYDDETLVDTSKKILILDKDNMFYNAFASFLSNKEKIFIKMIWVI